MLKLQEQLADRPVGRRVVYGTARLVVKEISQRLLSCFET